MSFENIQFDIGASLLALCKQFIIDEELENFEVFDFDAHTVEQEFPDNNLVGVAEYSLTEDQGMFNGHCMILISTLQDDKDLKVLKPLISKMFNRLRVSNSIPVLEATTGVLLGNLKIMNGTEASAVARTQARPLQAINITFGVAVAP